MSDRYIDSKDEALLQEMGYGWKIKEEERSKIRQLMRRRRIMLFLAVIVGSLLLHFSYLVENESFLQTLCIEAGIALLLLVCVIILLRLLRRYLWIVVISSLFFAVVLAVASYLFPEPTKSILLSGAIAALLVIGIDFIINRWLLALERTEASSRKKFEEARQQIENSETVLDYKYAMAEYFGIPYLVGGIPKPPEEE